MSYRLTGIRGVAQALNNIGVPGLGEEDRLLLQRLGDPRKPIREIRLPDSWRVSDLATQVVAGALNQLEADFRKADVDLIEETMAKLDIAINSAEAILWRARKKQWNAGEHEGGKYKFVLGCLEYLHLHLGYRRKRLVEDKGVVGRGEDAPSTIMDVMAMKRMIDGIVRALGRLGIEENLEGFIEVVGGDVVFEHKLREYHLVFACADENQKKRLADFIKRLSVGNLSAYEKYEYLLAFIERERMTVFLNASGQGLVLINFYGAQLVGLHFVDSQTDSEREETRA